MASDVIITGRVVSPEVKNNPFASISIAAQGMDAEIILVGDANHTKHNVRNALSSPHIITGLAEAGVTQLGLEMPAALQYYLDQYQNNEIDRNEFIKRIDENFNLANFQGAVTKSDLINSIADTIDHAKVAGITIHFIDPGGSFDASFQSSPEAINAFNKITNYYIEEVAPDANFLDTKDVESFQEWIMTVHEKDIRNLQKDMGLTENDIKALEADMNKRITARFDDQELAKNIHTIMHQNPGEVVAIIYGFNHDNVAAILENKNHGEILVVDVHENGRAFYKDNKKDANNTPGHHSAGDPDLVITAHNGKVYITNQIDPGAVNALNGDDNKGIDVGASPGNGLAPIPNYQINPPLPVGQ